MTIPLNANAATVGTVAYWRSLAPAYGARTWRGGMEAFARRHGKAIAMLADDGARIVERDGDRIITHTLPADAVRWHKN